MCNNTSHTHHDVGMLCSMNKRKCLENLWNACASKPCVKQSSGVLYGLVEEPRETAKFGKSGIQTKQPPRVRCEDLQTKDKGWDKMALMAGQDQQLLIQREGSLDRPCHTIRSIQAHVEQRSSHSPLPSDTVSYKPSLFIVTLFCSGYYYIHFIDEVSKS